MVVRRIGPTDSVLIVYDDNPGYAVMRILWNIYIPLKTHDSQAYVYWTDPIKQGGIVAFQDEMTAWKYIKEHQNG